MTDSHTTIAPHHFPRFLLIDISYERPRERICSTIDEVSCELHRANLICLLIQKAEEKIHEKIRNELREQKKVAKVPSALAGRILRNFQ